MHIENAFSTGKLKTCFPGFVARSKGGVHIAWLAEKRPYFADTYLQNGEEKSM
jgi:hypothetical protein